MKMYCKIKRPDNTKENIEAGTRVIIQEKIDYLNKVVSEDIEYDNEKERLVLGFIFNIITSNTVMNRYCSTRYGNLTDNDISLRECINYIGKKLMKINEQVEE